MKITREIYDKIITNFKGYTNINNDINNDINGIDFDEFDEYDNDEFNTDRTDWSITVGDDKYKFFDKSDRVLILKNEEPTYLMNVYEMGGYSYKKEIGTLAFYGREQVILLNLDNSKFYTIHTR